MSVSRMNVTDVRPRARRMLVAGLLAVALLAGCGISKDDGPRDIVVAARDDNAGDNPQTEITATNTSVIYLVDTDATASSPSTVLAPIARDVAETIDNALATLFAGPTIREGNADLGTAIPPTERLLSATPNGDVVTVDISESMDSLSPTQRIAAVGQIVLTATGVAGVSGVVITVAGAAQPWPAANGSTTTDPLTRADFVALLPASATPGSSTPSVAPTPAPAVTPAPAATGATATS